MKVYILYNGYDEKIECVFKYVKDADDMLNSLKTIKDFYIEEHEVIE